MFIDAVRLIPGFKVIDVRADMEITNNCINFFRGSNFLLILIQTDWSL